jgi:hypothetical protein
MLWAVERAGRKPAPYLPAEQESEAGELAGPANQYSSYPPFRQRAALRHAMVNEKVMRLSRIFLLLSSSMLISGCFPVIGHYYVASTTGGTVSRPYCHGGVGPEANVDFERGGVKVLVTPNQNSAQLTLTVQFTLQADDRISAQWNDIEAIDNFGNKLPIVLESIHGYKYPDSVTHARYVLDLVDSNDFNGKNYNLYYFQAQVRGGIPEKFTFVIPSMTVNGIEYPIKSITLEKQFGWWMEFINC